MLVRVYDRKTKQYYKSILYATVDSGWFQKDVVLNPFTDFFELVDYFDKSQTPAEALVESIQKAPAEYKEYKNTFLLKFKKYCREHQKSIQLKSLWGYPDVCENYAFLTDLLENGSVSAVRYPVQIREPEDQDIWTYIWTQQDADTFMKLFAGFHDSYLIKIVYSEEYGYTNAIATFDNSCWYGIVELCFEGVQTLHIKSAKENYDNYIYDATLLVKDEMIFWTDDILTQEGQMPKGIESSYDGSYILSLNLKWRKIG